MDAHFPSLQLQGDDKKKKEERRLINESLTREQHYIKKVRENF